VETEYFRRMERGSNLDGVRRYNERLVLSLIRRRDGASKTDIAKGTGLSAQAAVRIVDTLEEAGLVVRTGKRMGGMGQPSIIYKVNREGGFTIGVEVGRERISFVRLNYSGEVIERHVRPVRFPVPNVVVNETAAFVERQLLALPRAKRASFLGIGIAMPWFISEWRQEIGISDAEAQEWQRTDLEALFRSRFDYTLCFENDGNAGALAELLNGVGVGLESYLYLHIGTFIGGGLVLRGQLEEGRHGNAAAIASMPVPAAEGSGIDFLIHRASRYALEQSLHRESGGNVPFEKSIEKHPDIVARWVSDSAKALAFAIVGANSLLNLQAIIIGGDLPEGLLTELISTVQKEIVTRTPPDFFAPKLLRGTMGPMAAVIGAGLLPMYATFTPSLASLLKTVENW
jgi:predicted NBD/HSP70 family sugar kinase/predicted transcriptional regulator